MTTHHTTHQAGHPTARHAGHGPGHHCGHRTEDLDWAAIGDQLERSARVRTPFLEGAADWLAATADGEVRRVLDVGSGPGVASLVLARRFPRAGVVAVDAAPGLLARAAGLAAGEGLAGRVTTHRADLPDGLEPLGAADLIWAGQVVHHLGDQTAALAAIGRSLRPGGLLAVVEGGLGPRFLPRDIGMGRPGLQARLEAGMENVFAAMRAGLPGSVAVTEDWPALFTAAGLTPAGSRTFLVDAPAPLDDLGRGYAYDRLNRAREGLADVLPADDLEVLDRLLDEESEAGVRKRADVFCLEALTVHVGRRV
ncbi:class I SAM-dependent methyltransferase [Streptomyces sp. HU2014]|uniref:class I SAM-dependent methyltransferase n=1 Tax=Streptomyces sp. HU2014 TaxID=2939414 RepID=UPI002010BF24|nr:class I SAM-dependent methyltransferase [Streptomyces sp. HU2014]UQI44835.1 class I SAM-dependent methyltransferase [Streptomyces sp. HU2014]